MTEEKLKIRKIWEGWECRICGFESQQPLEHFKKEHMDTIFFPVKHETEEDVDFTLSNDRPRMRGGNDD